MTLDELADRLKTLGWGIEERFVPGDPTPVEIAATWTSDTGRQDVVVVDEDGSGCAYGVSPWHDAFLAFGLMPATIHGLTLVQTFMWERATP